MPIGAISLRTNDNYKVSANKAQSFGKREDSDSLKSRKAAGIAISVGLFAATAIAVYAFRGKIAKLPIFKTISEKSHQVIDNASDLAKDLTKKGKKAIDGAADIAKGVGEKAKKVVDDASDIAKKAGDELKDLGEKGKEIADDAMEAIGKVAKEVTEKGKKIFKKS